MPNKLFYGDNLDNLRKFRDEIVDLCYIDPPFNSKRNYNHIYNNIRNGETALRRKPLLTPGNGTIRRLKGFRRLSATTRDDIPRKQ